MKQALSIQEIRESVTSKLARYFGVTPEDATKEQIYRATVLSVKDILTQKRSAFKKSVKEQHAKSVYYLCMEFLVGRSLKNNLCNLGVLENYTQVLKEFGFNIEDIYKLEPDPGLGNGGLGRLASCYLDGLTSQDYPAQGFSICYEYGLFRQRILDGEQIELPDEWLSRGDVWLVPRIDKPFSVKFGGHITEQWHDNKLDILYTDYEEVQAIPYDMMISGANSDAVNLLRLWRARDPKEFNMNLFSQGDYVRAMAERNQAEILTKVLYPADNHVEGKLLRLSQQYFLVSASLQCILSDHLRTYGDLSHFADKVAIHINDTHPALAVPELMRLLIDEHGYDWDSAWSVVTNVISYTNHTVMPEALEVWNEDLLGLRLPRIHTIITEINRRFCADLWNAYPGDWDRISRMSILCRGQVRMANLSIVGSHTVNGVSELHSDILKKTTFHDFYKYTPGKFTNVTNGIAYRRWLCYSNPALAARLDECIGTAYRKDATKLADFEKYADDPAMQERVWEIKRKNKETFCAYAKEKNGVILDPSSLFDVQIKRMHEYKRQLLNTLRIITLYLDLKENPNLEMQPQTFIFGAKAAPGYYMAKQTIKLICNLATEIEKDPKIREKLRVVFLEDYKVSVAEVLIPAAEISEQISLAGKEASGTSNMKLMLNGALTLGTMDGANIEICQAVGRENMYVFGLSADEVEELWRRGYSSLTYYHNNPKLKRSIDALNTGFNGVSFSEFFSYLLTSAGVPDPYLCLADFESYCMAHDRALADYADRKKWARSSILNTARAGFFSADRSIREYCDNIWHVSPVLTKPQD